MIDTKARGWKLRPDVTSNQGLITAQYISLYEFVCVCVCVRFYSILTHTLTTIFPLTVTCAPVHTQTRRQTRTCRKTHTSSQCNWQMSQSRPTETWGDGVIVVTLVYWCLFIHLRAHVSVFRPMNREMELWPLADCLNPSLRAVSLPYYHIVFNCLPSPLPFPLFLPLICHFSPSSPFALCQTLCTWLRCAGKCSTPRTKVRHNAEAIASLWDGWTNNLEKPVTAGEI